MAELTEEDRRFLLLLRYESPWERLEGLLLGIRPDATLRWEVPEHPRGVLWVLGLAADFCDKRDRSWRRRYAASGRKPSKRWRRRGPRAD